MEIPKLLYEMMYTRFGAPYDIGPRKELIELVESGRLKPCRAIDLGSGTASNCVYLAQHGFEVTGVDYTSGAMELGHQRAAEAGVQVNFVQDDLTNLQHIHGTYDLLVDYGTLDDLGPKDREKYIQNVIPLTHAESQFLIYCFEWEPRWWERFFFFMACDPGEIEHRFSPYFTIEKVAGGVTDSRLMPAWAAYLMQRNGVK
jgi:cyclopropane fatty-acyl-phospholipid synthase-like methyltransferase